MFVEALYNDTGLLIRRSKEITLDWLWVSRNPMYWYDGPKPLWWTGGCMDAGLTGLAVCVLCWSIRVLHSTCPCERRETTLMNVDLGGGEGDIWISKPGETAVTHTHTHTHTHARTPVHSSQWPPAGDHVIIQKRLMLSPKTATEPVRHEGERTRLILTRYFLCGYMTQIYEWVSERLNWGTMWRQSQESATSWPRSQRGLMLLLWKQPIGREIKNRFISIYI